MEKTSESILDNLIYVEFISFSKKITGKEIENFLEESKNFLKENKQK